MTNENHASLRVDSRHYRIADIVIGVAFVITAVVSAYLAIAHETRDYWALLVVGVVGAILMFRRSLAGNRTP
ncbi:MAG: hypothetical protein M9953_02385 [Thermomicrobiales bacterium]|nr:hypothetical protein [Thermomicrobiales bacterium]MCO5217878.1 hypothetical protein [Thermomicrobiales bacterium]MCO5224161.1 hypothetical protein [Thermomicrobiales bacterium]MCO5227117.1 hypothetical protein [Thermomicrobiales bacterium]